MTPPPAAVRSRVVLLVLALAVAGALRSAASHHVGGDFLRYHRAGRLVATGRAERLYDGEWILGQGVYAAERAAEAAERGDRADPLVEEEFKYAPALAVLMAPLGALPPRTGWVLWGAWNGAMVGVTFAAAWAFAARGASWRWMLVPGLVLARAAADNHNLGQLNPSAIAPATVALWALDRGRDRTAGVAAAAGTVVKFLPALLAVWFAWRRRWAALAALAAGTVVLGAALPAAVLGPASAVRAHEEWLSARAHVYTDAASDDLPGHSVKSLVYRLLGDTHYVSGPAERRIDWDASVARLDPRLLQALVLAVVAALLLLVLRATRGPLRGVGDPRGPPEAALFVGWMLLASPEARGPHFLYLVLPGAALTYALVSAPCARPRSRAWATALAVGGALLVNTDSESLFGRDLANGLATYCSLGWATALLMASAVLILRDLRAGGGGDPDSPLTR